MEIFVNRNYQFVAARSKAYIISAALISLSVILFILRGLNYGVDFLGGSSMEVRFEKPIELDKVRTVISSKYTADRVQNFGESNDVLIHIVEQDETVKAGLATLLRESFPDNKIEERSFNQVGPKIGDELKSSAFWATFWGLAFIVVYLAIRFHWKWGLAAVVALAHDVIVTVGVFVVLQLEFSLVAVAALLTIVGYSVNDTIVVFDRIRENLRLMKRGVAFDEIVNKSVNETLSRTVMTSVLTLISVIVLLVLGGEVLRPFAWALMTGIVIGTYSSIFVASPILIEWNAGEYAKKQIK